MTSLACDTAVLMDTKIKHICNLRICRLVVLAGKNRPEFKEHQLISN